MIKENMPISIRSEVLDAMVKLHDDPRMQGKCFEMLTCEFAELVRTILVDERLAHRAALVRLAAITEMCLIAFAQTMKDLDRHET